jgi:hypothetical protein
MTKPTAVQTILIALFGKSHKAISEKLTTEEFNEFSEEAGEIQNRLSAQEGGNAKVVADLTASQLQVTELTTKLSNAEAKVTETEGRLTAMQADHDKYKAYYDKAAGQGNKEGNEDSNSRGKSGQASYNEHALEVFHESHPSK